MGSRADQNTQSQGANAMVGEKHKTKWHQKKGNISLETYLDFFCSNKQLNLTVDNLNQIVRMHGYGKVNAPKSALADAVRTIDLINPSRSTLKESVSSATIPYEDVMSDLIHLNWQECCVTSVLTFSSSKQNSSGSSQDFQEPKSKQNVREFERSCDVDTNDGVSASSCASKMPVRKSGPKRKKNKICFT